MTWCTGFVHTEANTLGQVVMQGHHCISFDLTGHQFVYRVYTQVPPDLSKIRQKKDCQVTIELTQMTDLQLLTCFMTRYAGLVHTEANTLGQVVLQGYHCISFDLTGHQFDYGMYTQVPPALSRIKQKKGCQVTIECTQMTDLQLLT